MAEKPIDPKTLKESLESLLRAKGTMEDLTAATKMYGKALSMSEKSISDMEAGLKEQVTLSNRLAAQARISATDKDKALQLDRLAKNLEEGALDIAEERAQAMADMLLKQTMYKTGLTGAYAEQAKTLILARNLNQISDTKLAAELQLLATEQKKVDHIREEVELTEQIADHIKEIKEESMAFKHQFEKILATSKAIATDPKALGAFFLTQVGEKIGHVNHAMHELVDTGMQAGEAINLMREDFSLMSAMGLSKVADVSNNLVANFGTAKVLTEEQRAAVGEMAYSMGLAGEEAANLTMALSRMPGESKDSATNFATTAKEVGKMKGVIPSQLMKEMAKNTGLMATFSKGGAVGFANAAASAKKMGVELGSVAASAEKLLDFESSINAQMEASVLIGKELNFDKVREASLAGDLNTVMEEQAKIMQQVGSLDQMNVLQKKALADAMGITTEELVKMSEAQKTQNQYFGENSTAMDNAIGYTMKLGGGIANIVKEYGMMAITLIQTGLQIGTLMALKTTKISLDAADTAGMQLNAAAQDKSTLSTKLAGNAAKSAGTSMLTMGAAILMIGAGIGLATVGIAQLADSLKGMTGGEMAMLGGILLAIGAGIFFLGQASLTASPGLLILGGAVLMIGGGIMMMGVGLGIAAAGMSLLVDKLKDVPFENLLALPVAFMGIGAGLYMMAAAGLAALPILGALTAFAVVAPALSGLGQGIGQLMGGTEGDDGKMDTLISEVRGLRTAMATPVIVTLDGRKLGEGVRNNTNYNRVR